MIVTSPKSLRRWCSETGVTQAVIATVAGVDASYLSRYTRGNRIPNAPLTAIQEAVETINDLRITPGSLVPNWRDAQSVKDALKHLAKMRQAEAEADKKPLIFATVRPRDLSTKSQLGATISNDRVAALMSGHEPGEEQCQS